MFQGLGFAGQHPGPIYHPAGAGDAGHELGHGFLAAVLRYVAVDIGHPVRYHHAEPLAGSSL